MPTTIVNKNVPLVHRKEFQMMTPTPSVTTSGNVVISDPIGKDPLTLFVPAATVAYFYNDDEDSYVQVASPALGSAIGAGSCGARSRWSTTITANGGSTTSATTATAITGQCLGQKIRFLSGANIGLEATITGIIISPIGSGTQTIQFAALPNAVANADTFTIDTGRFFVLASSTLTATSFRIYDPLLGTWTSGTNTGLAATWGTDGRLISTPSNQSFATGTATAGSAGGSGTTITNSGKAWTTNQWANCQIRITSGAGIGQIRNITSNTGTVITVSAAWTTTVDATSVYSIEGNDDYLYLMGNGAVTLYRYSISGNTWTTLSPTAARASVTGAGMTGEWIGKTGDANWALETAIQDGRYIYSFAGGAGSALHRYDIALNTWQTITYYPVAETLTTGTGSTWYGKNIYIRKDATNRYFKYDVVANSLKPFATNLYTDSTAMVGNKTWIKTYDESGTDKIVWVYSLLNTLTPLHRIMVI